MLIRASKLRPLRPKNSSSFRIERDSGARVVVGVDEVGRGCLAGPVCVAGVVFSREQWGEGDQFLSGVEDSKVLKAERRRLLSDSIVANALAVSIRYASAEIIDQINILRAVMTVAKEVVNELQEKLQARELGEIDLVLMDGPYVIPGLLQRQKAIVGGDQLSRSIAAASIVAKVARDDLMDALAKEHPHYGFEKNKGYGTSLHLQALRDHGVCSLHRRSFLKKLDFLHEGEVAESRVAQWLASQGFVLKHSRWRVGRMEIDLVAEKSDELHFFEVRFRAQDTAIDLAFPPAKQMHFRRAVDFFLTKMGWSGSYRLHFVLVTPETIQPTFDIFAW